MSGFKVCETVMCLYTVYCFMSHLSANNERRVSLPFVINTWPISNATAAAWNVLLNAHGSSLDALVAGCSYCESGICLPSIGIGGSPDENGETCLDAMVMDGATLEVGAVGNLRFIANASAVALAVLRYTRHTLLVGDLATDFAISMGFQKRDIGSNSSRQQWEQWKKDKCQPNFWQNVSPNPNSSCGPYKPLSLMKESLTLKNTSLRYDANVDENHHDTIGMIVVDHNGNIAAGTTTNGAGHKIPGRVGDSPIMGAGAYADNTIGGAVATGDGDVMMRFLPSFHAVELMRIGYSPDAATNIVINKIRKYYPNYSGALIAVTLAGDIGASCHGFGAFQYSLASNDQQDIVIKQVTCS